MTTLPKAYTEEIPRTSVGLLLLLTALELANNEYYLIHSVVFQLCAIKLRLLFFVFEGVSRANINAAP
jgi:hypothetical protein